MLYSFNSKYPEELPFRIRMPNGSTRTDPATFTAEEIADAGYVLAPEQPAYDAEAEILGWDGVQWIVVPHVSERRILTRHEFISRFALAEEVALEIVAASTDPMQAETAAGIRVFQRRLEIALEIDLDHPEVIQGLANCKSILMAAGVWADEATADARIAELRQSITE